MGTADFNDPANVIHIDRIYIPETQPRVAVEEVRLVTNGVEEVLIADGAYVSADAARGGTDG